MITVPLKTLRDFIMAQPAERLLNLYSGSPSNGIGCVLVHYCEQEGIKTTYCGFSSCYNGQDTVLEIEDSGSLLDLWDIPYMQESMIESYGELQPHII